MADLIARIQQFSEIVGPNVFLQAAIIAVAFIVIGKIADWIISAIIGRIARRSANKYDDQFVAADESTAAATWYADGRRATCYDCRPGI